MPYWPDSLQKSQEYETLLIQSIRIQFHLYTETSVDKKKSFSTITSQFVERSDT